MAAAGGYVLLSQQQAVYAASATLTLRDPSAPGVFSNIATGNVNLDRHVEQQADFATSRAVLRPAAESLGMPVEALEQAVASAADINLGQVTVLATGPSGTGAAARANGVADTYEKVARRRSADQVAAATSVFQEQVQQLRKQQRQLESQLSGVAIENRDPLVEARAQSVSNEIAALQTRIAELGANAAVYGSGIEAREQAVASDMPETPMPLRDAVITGLLGFIVVSVFAYWRSGRAQREGNRADAGAVLVAPKLGEIRERTPNGSGGHAVFGWDIDAYEFVVSSIDYAMTDMDYSSVLITSAGGGGAKTATALHLAMATALSGRGVCLVDADLRAHELTSILRAEEDPGLMELAAGTAQLTDCIQRYRVSDHLAVDLVPSGDAPETLMTLMRGPNFNRAMQRIKEHAQRVILDSPPLMEAPDATIIATHVDAIVIVITPEITEDELHRIKERLTFLPTPLLGFLYSCERGSPSVGLHSANGQNGSRHLGPLRRSDTSAARP